MWMWLMIPGPAQGDVGSLPLPAAAGSLQGLAGPGL